MPPKTAILGMVLLGKRVIALSEPERQRGDTKSHLAGAQARTKTSYRGGTATRIVTIHLCRSREGSAPNSSCNRKAITMCAGKMTPKNHQNTRLVLRQLSCLVQYEDRVKGRLRPLAGPEMVTMKRIWIALAYTALLLACQIIAEATLSHATGAETPVAATEAPTKDIFGLAKVHEFHLELTAKEWERMQAVIGGM